MLSWGEQYLPSGPAAIFIATVPLWMTGMARVFQGEPIRRTAALGLVLGLVGIVVLVGPAALQGGPVVAMLACLLAALGWAAATVYSRTAPFPENPFQVAGMQMFAGGVVVFLFSLVTGDASRFSLAHVSVRSEAAFLYLATIGTLALFIGVVYVVQRWTASASSYVTVLFPVVTVSLGAILAGELVSLQFVVGAAMVMAGTYVGAIAR